LLLLSAIAFVALARMTRRMALSEAYGSSSQVRDAAIDTHVTLSSILLLALATLLVAVPIGNPVAITGRFPTFAIVPAMIAPDLRQGAGLAAGVAALNVAIAIVMGHACDRRVRPAGTWLRVAAVLAFAVPSSLLGLEMIRIWNQPNSIGWVYDSG